MLNGGWGVDNTCLWVAIFLKNDKQGDVYSVDVRNHIMYLECVLIILVIKLINVLHESLVLYKLQFGVCPLMYIFVHFCPLLSTFYFVHFQVFDMEWTKVDVAPPI